VKLEKAPTLRRGLLRAPGQQDESPGMGQVLLLGGRAARYVLLAGADKGRRSSAATKRGKAWMPAPGKWQRASCATLRVGRRLQPETSPPRGEAGQPN